MDSEKIQQLSDEIKLKLSESLSNLSEVFEKYGISEGVQVEIKFDASKLHSSDAPEERKLQEVLLESEARKVLLETESQKALLEIIEPQKLSLKNYEKLPRILVCKLRKYEICPSGNHPNGNCWHLAC
jgi:hypothetical protein